MLYIKKRKPLHCISKRNFQHYLEAEKKSVNVNSINNPVLLNEVRINECFNNVPAQSSSVNSCITVTNEITLYPKQIDSNFSDNMNNVNYDTVTP